MRGGGRMAAAWYEAHARRPYPADEADADPAGLLTDVLERAPRAIIVVNLNGNIRHANGAGARLLLSSTILKDASGRLEAVGDQAQAITTALIAAADPDDPRATCLLIRRDGVPSCVVSVGALSATRRPAHILLMAQELPVPDASLGRRLRMLFGLTRAEEEIALGISEGKTLQEIADGRQVSVQTVRGQLKPLSRKFGCRRQSEIAALVPSILPVHGYGEV
jgi:DNA-binding CsgD family transcriptional regulator